MAPADTISLAMGEPDFSTPQVIVDAMEEALRQGATHYGDLNGDPELRRELAQRHSSEDTVLTAENVSITHGGAGALTSALMAEVSPGQRVVIPEPTYSLYQDILQLIGAFPVYVPLHRDNQLDVDAIVREAADAAAVVICNPGNPTGTVLHATSLEELGARLPKDTVVIADEAYSRLTYTGEFVSVLEIASLAPRAVAVQTFSKTYAMTGWRLGYSVAPVDIATRISLVHRTLNSAVNAAVQRAGLAALRSADADASRMLDAYRERRDRVVDLVDQIPGLEMVAPNGAFYAFIRYDEDVPADKVKDDLLAAGVAVRSGEEYGPSGANAFRISFAAPMADIETALERIANYFVAFQERIAER